jgi:hypothetical protein
MIDRESSSIWIDEAEEDERRHPNDVRIDPKRRGGEG